MKQIIAVNIVKTGMRNSKEIAHTLNSDLHIQKYDVCKECCFYEEMEELPFLAFGILTFSFKKTFYFRKYRNG